MDLGNQIENSVAAAEPSLGPPPAKKNLLKFCVGTFYS